MSRAIYVADSQGLVTVASDGTPVSVFGIKGDAGHGIDLQHLGFSVKQTVPTATEDAIYIEFCAATFATNAPGTNSTAVTVDQRSGPRIAETFAVAKTWTAEPTVLTPLDPFEVDPYKFTYSVPEPLLEGADSAAGEGFVLRVTNPAANTQDVLLRIWARWSRV